MKVMLYGYSNTTPWWRYIATRLSFASSTVLVSDLTDADVDINPLFHRNMRREGLPRVAVNALGDVVCDQVMGRCRVLRTLNRDLALKMIGAMWLTIEETLDRERPDVALSFVVDRYIADLFERALARRGVRYVGMTAGPVPNTFMFMSRGEYTPVREPSDAEVEAAVAALTAPTFAPAYVTNRRFGLAGFLAAYTRLSVRWLAFEVLRIVRRRPYDFRYLSARGFRVRLRDWGVMRYFRNDWRKALEQTPSERRIFVGLSVNPEAAIEYWVRNLDMVDYQAVLKRLASTLSAAGYRLFVKDHPTQFGLRQIEVFSEIAKHEAVTFVPYDVPGQWLVGQCRATFTWTGTVGLQAAMAGKCAVVEANAYYAVDGLFVLVGRPADLDGLARRVEEFEPSLPLQEARRTLARHLLRSSVPGNFLSYQGFSLSDPASVRRTDAFVTSLNEHLPSLAKMGPPDLSPAMTGRAAAIT
jgi:hypothetical protein